MKLNKKGETLVEALCALGILSLVMFAFPNILVSANKMNKTVKDEDMSYNAKTDNPVNVTVMIKEASEQEFEYGYNRTKGYIDNEFYYYRCE